MPTVRQRIPSLVGSVSAQRPASASSSTFPIGRRPHPTNHRPELGHPRGDPEPGNRRPRGPRAAGTVHRSQGAAGGHAPPHGAGGGHWSRSRVGRGGGASSGDRGGGAGPVPPARSCISALTHVINPASDGRSRAAAAFAKRAARSRHSAEGSAWAGPRADTHRPSAGMMTQMLTRIRVPMRRFLMARPLAFLVWDTRIPWEPSCSPPLGCGDHGTGPEGPRQGSGVVNTPAYAAPEGMAPLA